MMSKTSDLRLLIVDDEEPARLLLRDYLRGAPGVTIVGECADGFAAVKAVTDLDPDLLLLDIQMPKLDGLEVLELIGREIAVVFVTAYDEYSTRAFEIHAVDYLLKPYSRERLLEALDRARERVARLGPRRKGAPASQAAATAGAGSATLPETVAAMDMRRSRRPLERILIRDRARIHVIPVGSIHYVEAQDDYISIVTKDRKLLKQQTLNELGQALDERRFVRVHRSFLLNIEHLARIETYAKDSRIAILKSGAQLPVSRSGYERLRGLL